MAAIALAAWNIIPVYYDHYDFTDAVEEICRTPKYKARTDKAIMEMLMKEVENRRLDDWIGPESFEISTSGRNRVIDLYYEREIRVPSRLDDPQGVRVQRRAAVDLAHSESAPADSESSTDTLVPVLDRPASAPAPLLPCSPAP